MGADATVTPMALRNPERSEIGRRIARLPALEEALDRRVEDGSVELFEPEQTVAPDGVVGRGDSLQRPLDLAREDDVDDVLRRQRPSGRDRVDDGDRALEGRCADPHLLGELPTERVHQRLARVDAAAREEPDVPPALVVAAEQDPVAPAEERRDADARFHPHQGALAVRPDDPWPRVPRSVSDSSSSSSSLTPATSTSTSCAIRIPGSTTNDR